MASTLKNQHQFLAKDAYDQICRILKLEEAAAKNGVMKNGKYDCSEKFINLLSTNYLLSPWEQETALQEFGSAIKDTMSKTLITRYLKFCKEYKSHIRKFPAMIRINSLSAAWAFVGQKRKKDNPWEAIHRQFKTALTKYSKDWLLADNQNWKGLDKFILSANPTQYKLLTKRALQFSEQLADYAVGMMPKELPKKVDKKETAKTKINSEKSEEE